MYIIIQALQALCRSRRELLAAHLATRDTLASNTVVCISHVCQALLFWSCHSTEKGDANIATTGQCPPQNGSCCMNMQHVSAREHIDTYASRSMFIHTPETGIISTTRILPYLTSRPPWLLPRPSPPPPGESGSWGAHLERPRHSPEFTYRDRI